MELPGRTAGRRVLVVHSRAGRGHLATAEILAGILVGDPAVDVRLMAGEDLELPDPEDPGPIGEHRMVALWNLLIRRGWLRLADVLFNHLLRIVLFPFLLLGAGHGIRRRVAEMRPDAIVSTADMYSRPLGDAARDLGVPFTVMPCEFSVFADALHPDAEYLCRFEETCSAIGRFDLDTPYFGTRLDTLDGFASGLRFLGAWFRTYGLRRLEPLLYQPAGGSGPRRNNLRCHVVGPLGPPASTGPPGPTASPDLPSIIVASGSIGGHHVTSSVDALIAEPALHARITALCGHSEAAVATLRSRSGIPGRIELEVEGFLDDLHGRLHRASLLVARPTAAFFVDAILADLPVLVPARATRNDMGTIDLVRRWGVGETYARDDDMATMAVRMLTRLDYYRSNLRRLRSRYPEPREIVAERVRGIVWRAIPVDGAP